MAKKTNNMNGLSGKKTVVELPYDGEKYVHPVYVGINGRNWMIRRGEPVEVPVEVADVLDNSKAQDTRTARMIRDYRAKAQSILE